MVAVARYETNQRRVYVPDMDVFGPLARALQTWTSRLGHALVTDEDRDDADLEVLPAGLGLERSDRPWISVSSHRGDADPSAAARLEGHHGLLDLAFAFAEQLFVSRCEQRRYGLRYGRLEVEMVGPDGEALSSRLVGLNRCGAWVASAHTPFPEGALVDLTLPENLLGLGYSPHGYTLRGRVMSPDPKGELIGVELMLEACEGFPSFRSLSRRLSSRVFSLA